MPLGLLGSGLWGVLMTLGGSDSYAIVGAMLMMLAALVWAPVWAKDTQVPRTA